MELAEPFGVPSSKIDLVDTQWRKLTLVNWVTVTDTIGFWFKVLTYRDAAGSNPFHNLAHLAIDVLSFSHSNVEVERVFSQLSVKTKHRNCLSTKSTNIVLNVRSGIRRLGKCCRTYDIPDTVTKKVGTLQAYLALESGSSTGALAEEHIIRKRDEELHLGSDKKEEC